MMNDMNKTKQIKERLNRIHSADFNFLTSLLIKVVTIERMTKWNILSKSEVNVNNTNQRNWKTLHIFAAQIIMRFRKNPLSFSKRDEYFKETSESHSGISWPTSFIKTSTSQMNLPHWSMSSSENIVVTLPMSTFCKKIQTSYLNVNVHLNNYQ